MSATPNHPEDWADSIASIPVRLPDSGARTSFQTGEDHLAAVGWNMACAAWTEAAINAGRLPSELMDLPFRLPQPPTQTNNT